MDSQPQYCESFPAVPGYSTTLLWPHGPAVDPDVVDQAGEEAAGFHSLTGTDIQAGARALQTGLSIPGDCNIIDVQNTV